MKNNYEKEFISSWEEAEAVLSILAYAEMQFCNNTNIPLVTQTKPGRCDKK